MTDQQRAQFLVVATMKARQAGKDSGYITRLAESYGNSFVSAKMSADLADLCACAIARLAGELGRDFEDILAELDAPGVVRAADHVLTAGPVPA